MLIEVKGNPAAASTGNVALEEDILETSKADYFLIAFPVPDGWHGRMLHRLEVDKLLKATKMTWNGRTYKYKRVPAGQNHRPQLSFLQVTFLEYPLVNL